MKKLFILLLSTFVINSLSAQTKKDTLVVPPYVKVVVIDGVVYNVVRSVELKINKPEEGIKFWIDTTTRMKLTPMPYWYNNNVITPAVLKKWR